MGVFPGPDEVEGSCVCRSAGGHQQGPAGVPQRVHGGHAEGRVPGERRVGGDGGRKGTTSPLWVVFSMKSSFWNEAVVSSESAETIFAPTDYRSKQTLHRRGAEGIRRAAGQRAE